MPTGYTYEIEEGCTFNEFIMSCARAFGALIHMRDSSSDAEIPEEIKPSEYHAEQLVAAEERWMLVHNMGYSQLRQEVQAEYDRAMTQWTAYRAEKKKHREQYALMLTQVEAWKPPTADHVRLKEFMREQIDMSLPCPDDEPPPVLMSYPEWQEKEVEKLRWNVKYHRRNHAEEVTRCKERTQWVKDLRASLTNKE